MKTMVSTLASVALVACSVCPDNRGTKASTSEIAHNVRVPKVISKSVASKSMSLAEPIFVLTRGRHPWSAASLARPWQARGTVMHTFSLPALYVVALRCSHSIAQRDDKPAPRWALAYDALASEAALHGSAQKSTARSLWTWRQLHLRSVEVPRLN
jgi:hypothetical protein